MDSSYSESDEESYNASDSELQEAFAKGLLKPGLNIVEEIKPKKVFINDTEYLDKTLNDIKLNLPWLERLDITTSGLAPMMPEQKFRLQESENQAMNKNKTNGQTVPEDDLRREIFIETHVQQAILFGMKKLKSLNINTKRVEDYFVEMVKSDEHMHKIRKSLQHKQLATERSEKAQQYRAMKKVGKQLQIQAKLRKINEKKEMLNEVKKFRKGKRQDLDFLENNPKKGNSMNKKTKSTQAKNDYKNKKFGYGGKKRGSKINTKSSNNDVNDNKKKFKQGSQKRLGKNRRKQNKSNKK